MTIVRRMLAGITGAAMLACATALPVAAQDADAAIPAPGFKWSGVYVGAYAAGVASFLFGTRVGYNFVGERLVVGVETGAGVATFVGFVDIRGRVGALVRERAFAYYVMGLLFVPAAGQSLFTIGGGLEYAIGRDLSVFAEAGAVRPVGGPPVFAPIFQIGVNWHPGN